MRLKALVTLCIIALTTTIVSAHEGLYLKFSLGPGFMKEFSSINGSGFTIAAKNHAIGWGFNEKIGLFIGEFGGLNKKKVGEYNYINLDAYGPGFTYSSPSNINLSVSAGYGQVAFARKWSEATGDVKGKGFGLNMSLEKEWMVSKRVGIGTGAQAFYIKTKNDNYEFMSVSIKCMVNFYFTPVR